MNLLAVVIELSLSNIKDFNHRLFIVQHVYIFVRGNPFGKVRILEVGLVTYYVKNGRDAQFLTKTTP